MVAICSWARMSVVIPVSGKQTERKTVEKVLKWVHSIGHLDEVGFVGDSEEAMVSLVAAIVETRRKMNRKTHDQNNKPHQKGRTARVERFIQERARPTFGRSRRWNTCDRISTKDWYRMEKGTRTEAECNTMEPQETQRDICETTSPSASTRQHYRRSRSPRTSCKARRPWTVSRRAVGRSSGHVGDRPLSVWRRQGKFKNLKQIRWNERTGRTCT